MAKNVYPGKKVKQTSQRVFVNTDLNKISDYLNTARQLSKFPEFIEAKVSDQEFLTVYKGMAKTHFQGIVRKLGTNVFFISGGDSKKKIANLFIVRLGSKHQKSRRPLGTNILYPNNLSPDDKHIENIELQTDTEWHAGGMALLGDLLAIPI